MVGSAAGGRQAVACWGQLILEVDSLASEHADRHGKKQLQSGVMCFPPGRTIRCSAVCESLELHDESE